jgi:hypothetical protein
MRDSRGPIFGRIHAPLWLKAGGKVEKGSRIGLLSEIAHSYNGATFRRFSSGLPWEKKGQ